MWLGAHSPKGNGSLNSESANSADEGKWQIGLVGTAGPASWYRHSGDPEPARV